MTECGIMVSDLLFSSYKLNPASSEFLSMRIVTGHCILSPSPIGVPKRGLWIRQKVYERQLIFIFYVYNTRTDGGNGGMSIFVWHQQRLVLLWLFTSDLFSTFQSTTSHNIIFLLNLNNHLACQLQFSFINKVLHNTTKDAYVSTTGLKALSIPHLPPTAAHRPTGGLLPNNQPS